MPYTPIISKDDLKTHLYSEKVTAISRADDAIVNEAIDNALSEVKSFLGRFDVKALFGDPVADTAATVTDKYLNRMVKDVAVWHFVSLANVGIDLTVIRTRYDDTLKTLRRIQEVQQTPDGWPYADLDTATPGNSVIVKSRKKRSNNW
jgi:hypothetical protein